MRFPIHGKSLLAALSALGLIAFGGVSLLRAQRQPAREIIRIGPDRAWLGIEMEEVTAENMASHKLADETGVIVRSVEKGSPAETARLQEGDVILEYAGIPVLSIAALTRLVQETPIHRTVKLAVSREGRKIDLNVKVGERDADRFGLMTQEPLRRQFDVLRPGERSFQFVLPRRDSPFYEWFPRTRPQLGVTVETLTEQMASFLGVPGKKGLLITSVTESSPAATALRAGDVIVSVDGTAMVNPSDLTQLMARKEPGGKLDLKIIRDKKEASVSIELPK